MDRLVSQFEFITAGMTRITPADSALPTFNDTQLAFIWNLKPDMQGACACVAAADTSPAHSGSAYSKPCTKIALGCDHAVGVLSVLFCMLVLARDRGSACAV